MVMYEIIRPKLVIVVIVDKPFDSVGELEL